MKILVWRGRQEIARVEKVVNPIHVSRSRTLVVFAVIHTVKLQNVECHSEIACRCALHAGLGDLPSSEPHESLNQSAVAAVPHMKADKRSGTDAADWKYQSGKKPSLSQR